MPDCVLAFPAPSAATWRTHSQHRSPARKVASNEVMAVTEMLRLSSRSVAKAASVWTRGKGIVREPSPLALANSHTPCSAISVLPG